jgi:hypothetical protein
LHWIIVTTFLLYVSRIDLDPNLVFINKEFLKWQWTGLFWGIYFGDFDCIASIPDPELALNHFSKVFNCIVDKHAPFTNGEFKIGLALGSVQSYLKFYTSCLEVIHFKSVQSCHQGKGWLFEESQILNIFWFV